MTTDEGRDYTAEAETLATRGLEEIAEAGVTDHALSLLHGAGALALVSIAQSLDALGGLAVVALRQRPGPTQWQGR